MKVFLTASPEVRARRRHAELVAKGGAVSYEEVLADQLKRDHDDSSRAVAPLRPAAEAVVVDTSALGPDEVIDHLVRIVEQRLLDRSG